MRRCLRPRELTCRLLRVSWKCPREQARTLSFPPDPAPRPARDGREGVGRQAPDSDRKRGGVLEEDIGPSPGCRGGCQSDTGQAKRSGSGQDRNFFDRGHSLMRTKLDLKGLVFDRLTVLREGKRTPRGDTRWWCRCSCGAATLARTSHLRSGCSRSCGCLSREAVARRHTTHGDYGSVEYRTWRGMINRCYYKRGIGYANYGGRGITVCPEWHHDYATFLASVGRRPSSKYSLGRIDNDGNYEPGNVTWQTSAQQSVNKRTNHFLTRDGETLTLKDWARRLGIYECTIRERIRRGQDPLAPSQQSTGRCVRRWLQVGA